MNKTLKQLIDNSYIPQIEYYVDKIYKEKENLEIDGIKCLDGRDKMVAGVIVQACCCLLENSDKSSDGFSDLQNKVREIIKFTSEIEMITWGRYFYLIGLNRLKKNGMLEGLISEDTLEVLKDKLDWRDFVNEKDLSLIKLPTNYYIIAYIIAKCRELMGWEQECYSLKFYNKLMDHIDEYSNGSDFIDETEGCGRFDEYSLLTPGEMSIMFLETSQPVPENITKMLRKSCDIYLTLANMQGKGFSYGRSLGAHGDITILTVLPVAAKLGLLSPDEMEIAYAYTIKVAERYVDFWIDKDTGAVNLWDKGRKIDYYRDKSRILESTIDNYRRVVSAYEDWKAAGFGDREIAEDFEEKLKKIPSNKLFKFYEGDYDRGLFVRRDQGYVFSLPMVNGGKPYYCNTTYLPIPFETDLVEATADTKLPNLVPRLVLKDGSILMPIAQISSIKTGGTEDEFSVCYNQDALCLLGEADPRADGRIKCEVKYCFKPGVIEREDCFYSEEEMAVEHIDMEFGTFSEEPVREGNKIIFKKGSIYEIEAVGLTECSVYPVENLEDYKTPYGSLKHCIRWQTSNIVISNSYTIKWTIKYKGV